MAFFEKLQETESNSVPPRRSVRCRFRLRPSFVLCVIYVVVCRFLAFVDLIIGFHFNTSQPHFLPEPPSWFCINQSTRLYLFSMQNDLIDSKINLKKRKNCSDVTPVKCQAMINYLVFCVKVVMVDFIYNTWRTDCTSENEMKFEKNSKKIGIRLDDYSQHECFITKSLIVYFK